MVCSRMDKIENSLEIVLNGLNKLESSISEAKDSQAQLRDDVGGFTKALLRYVRGLFRSESEDSNVETECDFGA